MEDVKSQNKFIINYPSNPVKLICTEVYGSEKFDDLFCVQFDPEDKFLAGGYTDGSIRIFNRASGKMLAELKPQYPFEMTRMPICDLRWKPFTKNSKVSHHLAAVSADGYISFWHATSATPKHFMRDPNESDLYCLDYNKTGDVLATAGKDCKIRLYDDETKNQIMEMKSGGEQLPGHSNRVFSVRFTDDPNLLISGGWDNTIQIWDMRASMTIGSIYGPHICGDSLDVKGDKILTGSYRPKNCLEIFSLQERKKIDSIPWNGKKDEEEEYAFLYGAMFDKKTGKYIFAAGAGKNEAHYFNCMEENSIISNISGLPRSFTGVDMANTKNDIATANGDGIIRVYRSLST